MTDFFIKIGMIVLFFGVMLYGIMKFKKHPVIYIVIAAVVGIVFKF